MPTLEIPKPSPKQMQFLQDRHKYICFGGARGGGKSWAVRVKAILLCERFPGIKVMIVRKSYPELRENHIKQLRQMLCCGAARKEDRFASYNDGSKQITFPNGSVILLHLSDSY